MQIGYGRFDTVPLIVFLQVKTLDCKNQESKRKGKLNEKAGMYSDAVGRWSRK